MGRRDSGGRSDRQRPEESSEAQTPEELGFAKNKLVALLCAALAIATFLLYQPVIGYDFIDFDDAVYVYQNPHVAAGLTGPSVWWALTTFDSANWHPLTWLSLQADRDLYGGLKPSGYHFTNLVIHVANVVLLMLVLFRLTGAVWRSALVAGLFALHPLHVESVAWVAERKDVLSAFFWMLTLGAYALYVERPGWIRYGLLLVIYALGLTAKPMLVTLPFVLLLLDYWPLSRSRLRAQSPAPVSYYRLIAEKLPLIALALASSIVTVIAQGRAGAINPLEVFPLELRLLNYPRAYQEYLLKTFWPTNLSLLYLHPSRAALWNQGLAAAVLMIAVTVAVLFARRRPYLAVGWFWYLGTLVPVIGIVQVGAQSMADRYTYIPTIGIFLALAWAWGDLATAFGGRAAKVGSAVLAVLILAGCAGGTRAQLQHWRDAGAIWRHVIALDPNNDIAQGRLGAVYFGSGMRKEGIEHLARSVELKQDDAPARYALGMAYLTAGEPEKAITQLSEGNRLRPNWPDLHHKLALAYVLLPDPNLTAAWEHSNQSTATEEMPFEVLALRAYLDYGFGRVKKAAELYDKSLQLRPDWPAGANAQAKQLLARTPNPWDIRMALLYAKQACQATKERQGEFLETLAAAEFASGHKPDAIQALRKALALSTEKGDLAHGHVLEEQLKNYGGSK